MFEFNPQQIYLYITIAVSLIFGIFMFYRAGKHDLIDNDIIFDTVIIGFLGGLIGGRVLDFVLRTEYYNWSISKLIFFNVYRGIDLYGIVLGALILAFIYLNHKNQKSLLILDYWVTPALFSFSIYFLGRTFIFRDVVSLIYFISFIVFYQCFKNGFNFFYFGFFQIIFIFY